MTRLIEEWRFLASVYFIDHNSTRAEMGRTIVFSDV